MPWVDAGSFSVLRHPNGVACVAPWANPGYYHGVIMYTDGRVEAIPPTDHFASQKHMVGVPGVPEKSVNYGALFESSCQAAQAYAEHKLGHDPSCDPLRRETSWDRINRT